MNYIKFPFLLIFAQRRWHCPFYLLGKIFICNYSQYFCLFHHNFITFLQNPVLIPICRPVHFFCIACFIFTSEFMF